VETKNGNQINLKENKKDNNQGILKLTNYFDSKLGNVCGIVRSTYVCMYVYNCVDKYLSSTIDVERKS
jgi:hypothetical protein